MELLSVFKKHNTLYQLYKDDGKLMINATTYDQPIAVKDIYHSYYNYIKPEDASCLEIYLRKGLMGIMFNYKPNTNFIRFQIVDGYECFLLNNELVHIQTKDEYINYKYIDDESNIANMIKGELKSMERLNILDSSKEVSFENKDDIDKKLDKYIDDIFTSDEKKKLEEDVSDLRDDDLKKLLEEFSMG